MSESPDTEAIAARSEAAKVTGSWQPWWDDIDRLLAALAESRGELNDLREKLEFAEIVCSQVQINGMSWDEFKSRVTALALEAPHEST